MAMEGDMNTQEMGNIPAPMHEHHWGVKQTVWTIVVLVVLALVGVWLRGVIDTTHTTELIKPGQEITRIKDGLVIENFPSEFLIEDDVEVIESYSIAYSDELIEQPAVRYLSSLTLAENVSRFGDVLENGGWEVPQVANPESAGVTFFYATRGSHSVNITFVSSENGVEVSVSVSGPAR